MSGRTAVGFAWIVILAFQGWLGQEAALVIHQRRDTQGVSYDTDFARFAGLDWGRPII